MHPAKYHTLMCSYKLMSHIFNVYYFQGGLCIGVSGITCLALAACVKAPLLCCSGIDPAAHTEPYYVPDLKVHSLLITAKNCAYFQCAYTCGGWRQGTDGTFFFRTHSIGAIFLKSQFLNGIATYIAHVRC